MSSFFVPLAAFLASATLASAQVGVNQPTPEQTLDVNGKIKLADDATVPSAGTVRYNAPEADFEGYDGGAWQSFTAAPASGLPKGAVPIWGRNPADLTPSGNQTQQNIGFSYWDRQFSPSALFFDTPPGGKYVVITSIIARPVRPPCSGCLMSFRMERAGSTVGSSFGSRLFFTVNSNDNRPITADGAPLMVLLPGETLEVENIGSTSMYLHLRGFLVDELNYSPQ